MIGTKVIETRLAPGGHVIAITLFGLVLTRNKGRVDKYVLNHELIHCQQQREWLFEGQTLYMTPILLNLHNSRKHREQIPFVLIPEMSNNNSVL